MAVLALVCASGSAQDLFEKQVAPILQTRCIGCHNANDRQGDLSLQSLADLKQGGESGPVVEPGKPAESTLLDYISGDDPEMPKDAEPLSDQERDAIRKWIADGARWPDDMVLKNQSAIDRNWWSLKPIRRAVTDFGATNPVDFFVAKKHNEKGLEFAPEASRRELIRRLYFDLTGLPPSLTEIREFEKSTDPNAYEKLVDRLMASDRYGERWARHWLDVVQYGETHGYDKDKPRMNAWPYRDYVIRAFNTDKPYGRFVREQLAGDVLWPGTTDGIVATGFISAGPWDFIGHAEVPETKIDGQVARNLDRDNMVTSTMNTFCSLTVQCARCHNHKLDPVTMDEYYSLQAVFAAIDRADRDYDPDPEVAAKRWKLEQRIKRLASELDRIEKDITDRMPPEIRKLKTVQQQAEKRLSEAANPKTTVPASGRLGYHSQVAHQRDTEKWVQVDLGKALPIEQVILTGAVEYGFSDFGFPHRFIVEGSLDPEFKTRHTIADHRSEDFPRPGARPVVIRPAEASVARFVRVTATRLWSRRKKGNPLTDDWIFALGELSVISGGRLVNVRKVTALDSIEAGQRWSRQNLVDNIFGVHDLETRLGSKNSPTNGFHSQFSDRPDRPTWVQIDLGTEFPIEEIRLLPAFPTDFRDLPGFGFPVRFKLEIATDASCKNAHTVLDHTHNDFANPGTAPVVIPLDHPVTGRFVRLTATTLWNRGDPGGKNHALALAEMVALSKGKNIARGSAVQSSDSINSGRWHEKFLTDGYTSRFAIGDALKQFARAANDNELQEIIATAKKKRAEWLADSIPAELAQRLVNLKKSLADLHKLRSALPKPARVYAGTVHRGSGAFRGRAGLGPREIHVLHRGDVTRPGKIVGPGTVPFIPGEPSAFQLPADAPEGQRRVQLANWIIHPDNPLTWRSIVNRIWQHHFGQGIVPTANDFGRGGGRPSNPELLDWLAVEFRDGGKFLKRQSIKSLHRLICTSRTYRQTSHSTRYTQVDSGNRFLWRMNRRRLDAEEIHDSVLAFAGVLNLKMGGPPYQDFVIQRPEHSPHYEYDLYDPEDPSTHRRAIYRFIVRSQPQPLMDTLNCADPSISVPQRAQTLTALQALGMLNNRFMVAMAKRFAERLQQPDDRSLEDQVTSGFQMVTGRDPDAGELRLLTEYARKHGTENLCRVLLNLNEFVFVD